MSTMRDLEWLPPLVALHEDAERFARIKARVGRVERGNGYLMASDWLPEASAELNVALFTRVHLDHEVADLVGLAVSQESSCRYCFASTRTLLLLVGFSEDRIRRIEQNLVLTDLDDRTRAAVDFARRLARCDPHPTRADVAALRNVGFDDAAYRELVALVGIWVFFNRISTLTAMPPEFMETFTDRWWVKLLRPVAARRAKTIRKRGHPVALPTDMKHGRCAGLVNALDGLPAAPVLRRTIDAMWASDGLPARTRGFMCLTIARALACPTSEAEVVALLGDEGVSTETIEGLLGHLDAPSLTDTERLLVRFARETIWYEPAPLQRQAREVCDRLSEREFIEAIATSSVANAICRMHLALGLV